jgi:N-acylglucosamine-6-phosphate 2-epimerase
MNLLEALKGGVIVSCQPVDDGPMDQTVIIAAMAKAAMIGGAVGVRVEGIENVAATRAQMSGPIVGITKRDLDDTDVRITPFVADIDALIEAGADIVAVDATDRQRPEAVEALITHINAQGKIAMADCGSIIDATRAIAFGAQIVGTTLSGYVGANATPKDAPDFELVKNLAALDVFVMAEGRFNTPEMVQQALHLGADAVTVGSALTRLEIATSWFVDAAKAATKP